MVIIIGAGLSGLLTAYRLHQENIPYTILEARNRIGGRINTEQAEENTAIEMGATWFGSQHQNLIELLKELNIPAFEQYSNGKSFYQANPNSPAQPIEIPPQEPTYRISGGSSNLIHHIYNLIRKDQVLLNQKVTEIIYDDNKFTIKANEEFRADNIVIAIPPKLWANRIKISPKLPEELMNVAKDTHTWMEESIKVGISYNSSFWVEDGLSGTLFSNSGPIVEFYDHCNHERSRYALCGFMNPAYAQLSKSERENAVINQIKNVFGEKASEYLEYKECIWSEELFTYDSSESQLIPHQNNGHPIFRISHFDHKLYISSTEAALQFPGYMDGAVQVANSIAKRIIRQLKEDIIT
ncbi:flavin monoamine oxidase family protein [Marivirga arenosa]|uniref:NAD(P)/FAD-dependent oxidoreductase n=1 Tax=Marivirga arenosa TaxID=3059076 RepID=A0AA49GFR1_9BACT|nr:NAD(P)/FAD-dependent oxidoreductase [Marivirga sp. BKB1-2]WKK80293.2 NAD(P)/FAD-dependent oxidoreductase [Marivirga sp. BKB1-2]